MKLIKHNTENNNIIRITLNCSIIIFFVALQIHLNNIHYICNKIIFFKKKITTSKKSKQNEKTSNIKPTNLVSENEQPTPKGINFTYSENFNRVVELTTENYPDWRTNILYLLMINNLESYTLTRKVKKLRRRDIKDDPDDYLTDQFDPNLV